MDGIAVLTKSMCRHKHELRSSVAASETEKARHQLIIATRLD